MGTHKTDDRIVYAVIYTISAAVIAYLLWLVYFNDSATVAYGFAKRLPALNAFLNTATATLLILGYMAIKRGNRRRHVRLMVSALITSALFITSYIISHHYHGDTKFLAHGIVRPIYFFILISHIALSVIQVPLILITLYRAYKGDYIRHKKVAKVTFPIWLYVSVTGVLIFVFLKVFNAKVLVAL